MTGRALSTEFSPADNIFLVHDASQLDSLSPADLPLILFTSPSHCDGDLWFNLYNQAMDPARFARRLILSDSCLWQNLGQARSRLCAFWELAPAGEIQDEVAGPDAWPSPSAGVDSRCAIAYECACTAAEAGGPLDGLVSRIFLLLHASTAGQPGMLPAAALESAGLLRSIDRRFIAPTGRSMHGSPPRNSAAPAAPHPVRASAADDGPAPAAAPPAGLTGTADDWDEDAYLFFNPDVAAAKREGRLGSARDHWLRHGRLEGRAGAPLDPLADRTQFLPVVSQRAPGVNVYGFISTASGLGSHVRGTIRALQSRHLPFHTLDVPPWQRTQVERRNTIVEPYRINLIHQNADMMPLFLRSYGARLLDGCYNIGYWLWELPAPRLDWYPSFRYVDEVWVASEFCRASFSTMTALPVVRIPLVVDGLEDKAVFGRAHFSFPPGVFVFCYVFDVSSEIERKNPLCLIAAFRAEFGDDPNVLLFLKLSNSTHNPQQARLVKEAAAARNIRVFEGTYTGEEIVSLHNVIDCLVSPHRAEGFGFNLAEAMYFGKPVIATAYSANVDYMNDGNSYLLNYRLVPIAQAAGPYSAGFVWADPDKDHLRKLMRQVYRNADERERKGAEAARRIRDYCSAPAVGDLIRNRFNQLRLLEGPLDRSLFRPPLSMLPRLLHPATPSAAAAEFRGLPAKPLISVITPVFNIEPALLRKCVESVRSQYYPHWELCLCDDGSTRPDTIAALEEYRGVDPRIKVLLTGTNRGIAPASNRAAEISSGEFLAFLDDDDELTPDALLEVAKAINQEECADLIYSDEDKIDDRDNYCDHYFKPDWSPEHLQSVMYLLHLLVIRKALFYDVGGLRPEFSGAQDYDLALRASARARKVHHIPRVLYHWRKVEGSAAAKIDAKPAALDAGFRALTDFIRTSGIEADVLPGQFPGSFRVKHKLPAGLPVTLCILTSGREADVQGRGRINLVANFVRSIAAKTEYRNYEILIVDDGNLPDAVHRSLAGIDYRVKSFRKRGPAFNFSQKANFSFGLIRTEHLVLLNDDMEVISGDWLSALLEFGCQHAIGAVGGRLLFPDRSIQHAGVVIGVNGSAAHLYHSAPAASIGYNGYTHLIRNYSAVTAACLATRRSVIRKVGGFDERLAVDFNDIDFCLRVRAAGYRIVYTPYCELFHFEGRSFERRSQNPEEVAMFTRRWSECIARDPYYSPNLTRVGLDCAAAAAAG